jgi:arylsulfatase A
VPELTGQGTQQQHPYLYWEFYERGGKRAVRFGDWKAVQRNLKSVAQTDGIELYNLADDIAEQHNVATEYPDLIRQTRTMFEEAHTPSPFWSFGKRQR